MPPTTRKRSAQGPAAAAHSSTKKRNRHEPITIESPCAAFASSAYLGSLTQLHESKQFADVTIITTNRHTEEEEKIRAHRWLHTIPTCCLP